MNNLTYSDYTYRLISIGESLGITFILHDRTLPSDVVGRCDYKEATIQINDPVAKSALVTVAHELGHYISYLRNKDIEEDYPRDHREKLAYLYGWGILSKYANNVISKSEWWDFHFGN